MPDVVTQIAITSAGIFMVCAMIAAALVSFFLLVVSGSMAVFIFYAGIHALLDVAHSVKDQRGNDSNSKILPFRKRA